MNTNEFRFFDDGYISEIDFLQAENLKLKKDLNRFYMLKEAYKKFEYFSKTYEHPEGFEDHFSNLVSENKRKAEKKYLELSKEILGEQK